MQRRTNSQRAASILLLVAIAGMSGCNKARIKYTPPVSAPLAQAPKWNTPLAGGEAGKPSDEALLARWWTAFNDPLLTSLEERAVQGNLDLKVAESRVRQAKAQRDYAQLGLMPTVTGGASASGSHSGSGFGPSGSAQMSAASIDASWEPDFFGKLHGSVNASAADLDAARESLRNVLVSLTAEVALNYVDARSYQQRTTVTQANLETLQQTLDVTVARYQSGLATALDVEQARTNVQSTRSTLPALETGYQTAVNRIAVLMGRKPGAVDAELATVRALPAVPAEVAVGVPADLLRRRPDVRNAERQVAARTARLGVAQADLYPSFTLTGSLGLTATSFLNLFSTDAFLASVTGSVKHTLLDRRRIQETIKIQDAALDQSIGTYESTVLTALEDVENALLAFAKEQVRRKSLADSAASAGRASQLASDLYASGLKDFLTVLDSQRTQLSLQNQLVQSDAAIAADLVRLYKALGGGWDNASAEKQQGQGPARPGRTDIGSKGQN